MYSVFPGGGPRYAVGQTVGPAVRPVLVRGGNPRFVVPTAGVHDCWRSKVVMAEEVAHAKRRGGVLLTKQPH